MNSTKLKLWEVKSNQSFLHLEKVQIDTNCSLDLTNQRVIHEDSERTRQKLLTHYQKMLLEKILTFYCKQTKILYKQGLNQLLAPFVYLKRFGVSESQVFVYFKMFIQKYMSNMFTDSEFRRLQILLQIYKLVLKYFEPNLSQFLDKLEIGPELYACPWFLTMFASKIQNISVVFKLWQAYMRKNTPLYIVFLSVALLILDKKTILNSEKSIVAEQLTQLTIKDKQSLKKVLDKANQLMKSLPYSIYIGLLRYPLDTQSELDQLLINLEQTKMLSILPREVIMRCYSSNFKCKCLGNTCQWCRASENPVPLMILDCRPQVQRDSGIIPNTIPLDLRAFTDINFLMRIPNQYLQVKHVFHIALMGSQSQKYLKEQKNQEIDIVDRVIDQLYQAFQTSNFPYVSLVKGGFKDCHDLAFEFSLDVEGHLQDQCLACSPQGPALTSVFKRRIRGFRRSLIGKMKRALDYAECALNRRASKSVDYDSEENFTFSLKNDLLLIRKDIFNKIFRCKKFDRKKGIPLKEDLFLVLSIKEFVICSQLNEKRLAEDMKSVHQRAFICDLVKITSKRQFPNTLTFYFKNQFYREKKLSYVLNDCKESKACIHIISRYYNSFVPQNISHN